MGRDNTEEMDYAEGLDHVEALDYTEGLDYAERPCFVVATGRGLSEEYERNGPGVCLGDGQTEDEGVPS